MEEVAGAGPLAEGEVPPIRFAQARGARLAYQRFGAGSETVVAIPPTAQNIEVSWERPEIRGMLTRFASFCTYLHFDKRGTGCSDRRSRVADVDERVEDLRAVMDDAGIGRAHLFGSSEGGPMTLLFAATYPDRVASVMLFGSGASLHPADLSEQELAELRTVHRLFAAAWGTPESPVAHAFAPSLVAADPSFVEWHQRYERVAASQDSLRDLLELSIHMDAREVLPALAVPVMVIHRTEDRVVSVERGREVAEAVPDAVLLEQPGVDHFAYAGDVDGWMDAYERFVTGQVRSTRVAAATPPAVRILTLGRFAATVDGDEVPVSAWGSRLARQLCKRLVAARGWPVTREELFDLLWPDEVDRRRLGARLSVQLSTVRRVLRGGVIADRETVRLDLEQVVTDLEDLHRATDDAGTLDTYTGEFLPEDRYEGWAEPVREAARSRAADAARRLLAEAIATGATGRAGDLARRLLSLDRYDEAAHRALVRLAAGDGGLEAARRAHDAWAAAMAELDLPVPSLADVIGS
ncbi:alpha/beta fold hydrolase [Euzebya sp.]|uniref:alpha/beta fold hydrolase n=1 Tax=Euzebya sp. TaxID=1971409 RepID=UPI00351737E6